MLVLALCLVKFVLFIIYCEQCGDMLQRNTFITFRVRPSHGEMYIGHGRLCLSVPCRIPTVLHAPRCHLG